MYYVWSQQVSWIIYVKTRLEKIVTFIYVWSQQVSWIIYVHTRFQEYVAGHNL